MVVYHTTNSKERVKEKLYQVHQPAQQHHHSMTAMEQAVFMVHESAQPLQLEGELFQQYHSLWKLLLVRSSRTTCLPEIERIPQEINSEANGWLCTLQSWMLGKYRMFGTLRRITKNLQSVLSAVQQQRQSSLLLHSSADKKDQPQTELPFTQHLLLQRNPRSSLRQSAELI